MEIRRVTTSTSDRKLDKFQPSERTAFSCTSMSTSQTMRATPLSMDRRICRQVLDICSNGVFGVTALAVAALKIAKCAVDIATPTQSGDFEDSVAALQDADALEAAPFRFMAPMRVHCLEVEAFHEPSNLPPGFGLR